MKTRFCALCCGVATLLCAALQGRAEMKLYVSTEGNDSFSGRLPNVNKAKTDGPFATLERARDAIRALKRTQGLPSGGVTVTIRLGSYYRDTSFSLTEEDSGTPGSPIVYRPHYHTFPSLKERWSEPVRLVGGREVKHWEPAQDPRIEERHRTYIFQTDLKAQGITNYGTLRRRGFGMPSVAPLELFFRDQPMTLAGYPNGDLWEKIADTPDGEQGGKFAYEGDRPQRWKNADDLWIHGYWTWDWADSYEKVARIDSEKREIVTEPPHGVYGYRKGRRWRALNLLEELDYPGEYYLDRKTGILYCYARVKTGITVVSLLETPLITMENVSHVRIQGLILECSRGSGVEMQGGKKNLIAGCIIRNLGKNAVTITGATESGVQSCDIYDVGEGGITLNGGDRKTLTSGKLFAVNNHLYRYNRWNKTYAPAIGMDGVGARIAHNRIHDAPHTAILGGGNEHLIEYNEIYRVCLDTGDAGAFYMGRDLTMRGNVIRYNYFHDLRRGGLAGKEGFTDVMAVYLDDCFSGTTVFGNVFARAGRAVMIGGGRDNTVENNIFEDCAPAIHVDARGKSWAAQYFVKNGGWSIFEKLDAINPTQPPYSKRYPQLTKIREDDPAMAKGNRIIRNVIIGGKPFDLLDGLNDKTVHFEKNYTEGDSGLEESYRLRPDSPVWKLGFKPIPEDKIGLIKDAYRKAIPPYDVVM